MSAFVLNRPILFRTSAPTISTHECRRKELPRNGLWRAQMSQPDLSFSENENWDLSLGSPSKINLFLRVMGKRPDGKAFLLLFCT